MNYLLTKEQYLQVKANWKKFIVANKGASAPDIVVYNILRSFPTSRGFTDITNPKKLANGCQPNEALKESFSALKRGVLKWNVKEFRKELVTKFGLLFEDTVFWEKFLEDFVK